MATAGRLLSASWRKKKGREAKVVSVVLMATAIYRILKRFGMGKGLKLRLLSKHFRAFEPFPSC